VGQGTKPTDKPLSNSVEQNSSREADIHSAGPVILHFYKIRNFTTAFCRVEHPQNLFSRYVLILSFDISPCLLSRSGVEIMYVFCSFQAGSMSCFSSTSLFSYPNHIRRKKSFELPQYVIFCVIMLVLLSCIHIYPWMLCLGIFHNEISNHMKISNKKKTLLRNRIFTFMANILSPYL